jgi:hypothetical protein
MYTGLLNHTQVSTEWLAAPYPRLELTTWQAGHEDIRVLAYWDSHGRWIEWLNDIN